MTRVGVSLDFFGTLVEIDRDVPTIAQALTALGYPCSTRLERIWNSSGFDGQVTHHPSTESYAAWRLAAMRNLAMLCGAPRDAAEEVATRLIELDQTWTVRIAPGALDLIAALEELRVPMMILTNWDYPLAPYLRMAGLREDFPAISSSEIGVRKPHHLAFSAAREVLGVAPEAHIHVGDDWSADVVGAMRAGAWAVWLTTEQEALPPRIVATQQASAATSVRKLVAALGHGA